MLDFDPLEKESFKSLLKEENSNFLGIILQEDIRNVDEYFVESIFDYSPTMTYGEVLYN
jgi:hypothetical protein